MNAVRPDKPAARGFAPAAFALAVIAGLGAPAVAGETGTNVSGADETGAEARSPASHTALGGAELPVAIKGTFDLSSGAEAPRAAGSGNRSQAGAGEGAPQGQPRAQGSAPPGANGGKPVFDETWATVGLGAGLVPSYSGSDDYVLFPLPLIVGRIGGVSLTPNGPGITANLLAGGGAQPGAPGGGPRLAFGPAFRIRNDRNARIGDDVVRAAGELDVAMEVGANAGVSFPGIFNRFDSLSINTQVRWDILGAHDGMLIEPGIGYTTPLGRATLINLQAGLQFVDDSFADYYYTVSPAQSAASGLPQFEADGGLNSGSLTAILNYDLSGNTLDGGFSIYGVAGYSRLFGDGEDTPYTALRGNADQFIGGLGVAYTF